LYSLQSYYKYTINWTSGVLGFNLRFSLEARDYWQRSTRDKLALYALALWYRGYGTTVSRHLSLHFFDFHFIHHEGITRLNWHG